MLPITHFSKTIEKKLLTVILFSLTITICSAQTTFQKLFGPAGITAGTDVQQTTDGGYIMTGFESPPSSNPYVLLVKTNSNGDTLWTRRFAGSNNSGARSIVQTTDGGYIMAGFSNNTVAYEYIIKTDANGDTLWTKTFGHNGIDQEGESIVQTNDGGYMISGEVFSTTRPLLIKTNSNGDTLWTKEGISNSPAIRAYSIRQLTDGGYVLCGYTASNSSDAYLIRMNSNGDTLWTKTYGGAMQDVANCVRQTNDGGFILAGKSKSFGIGLDDVYLVKTDSMGSLQWSKTYGGIPNDAVYTVEQTTDGGYIMAGQTESFSLSQDAYLIKTDASGQLTWSKTYGGTGYDAFRSVKQTNDGGYIATGYTDDGIGNAIAFLVKTDANGNSGCNEATVISFDSTVTSLTGNAFDLSQSGLTEYVNGTVVLSGCAVTTTCSSTGTMDLQVAVVNASVYPNPFQSEAILKTTYDLKNATIKVFNLFGEQVEKINNITGKEIKLYRNKLPSGIYLIDLKEGNREIAKVRFILLD